MPNINIARSLWAGVAAYAINLTTLSVLSNLVGPFMNGAAWAPVATQIIFGAVTFLSTFLAVQWYFKGHSPNPTVGLIAGAIVAVSSLLITIVQVLPGMILQGGDLWFIVESFKNWQFWVIIAVTLVAGAVAGMMKKA